MAKHKKAKRPKKSDKHALQAAKMKDAKPKANASKSKAKDTKPKAKVAKPKAKVAKPKAKPSARSSASASRRPAPKLAPKRNEVKKPVAKKSSKPVAKKLAARKPVAVKKATPVKSRSKIAPTAKKVSQVRETVNGKTKAAQKITATKSKVVPAARAATTPKNRAAQKGTQPKNKNFIMSSESINNQKEVSPGGGLVLPATKSAPAMNLRPDDAAILASAKERYGRKDLDTFKNLLIEQLQEAKEEFEILSQNILDTSGEFEADNQNYSLHTAEQGTDAIEREKTFLHAQRTSDYIKRLEEALERIDRGIYGICVVCGGLIEKERLQAVPITQKHVDCKNRTQPRKPSGTSGFREHEEQPPPPIAD
jgi:DnaK suppressor protein